MAYFFARLLGSISPTKKTTTVVTLAAGVLILKESLGTLQILCAVLILLAVVGTNYFGQKPSP